MIIAKTHFSSEAEKLEYVRSCDRGFEDRLDSVMLEIFQKKDLRSLTLSGPTCSGKTTVSRKLISEFAERGKKVKIISLDDFFRSGAELEAEAKRENRCIDFDSERALDIPCLAGFIEKLRCGEPAMLPHFDFKLGRRTGFETFTRGDADILIFEGIQAIYPVFTDMLRGIPCLSLIINVASPICVDGREVDARTVRLMRRLVRDARFRGAAPQFTFQLWESVTRNEDVNILPFIPRADITIDSLMGYEPCMLKPYLESILGEIPRGSRYTEAAQDLLSIVKNIDAISSELIPENGLYREFI